MDYPSISIDKYRYEKLSSERARDREIKFQYRYISISIVGEIDAVSDTHACAHIYEYLRARRPMDFLRGIAFAACTVLARLAERILNDRFLRLWII